MRIKSRLCLGYMYCCLLTTYCLLPTFLHRNSTSRCLYASDYLLLCEIETATTWKWGIAAACNNFWFYYYSGMSHSSRLSPIVLPDAQQVKQMRRGNLNARSKLASDSNLPELPLNFLEKPPSIFLQVRKEFTIIEQILCN